MGILKELGVDERFYTWGDLSACRNMDWEFFFETYEEDPYTAMAVDELCLSCPVARFCLEMGADTKSDGVWGGVYLTRGEVDQKYNVHKTDRVWSEWREQVGIHP
jgi:Transcription factor WhiB